MSGAERGVSGVRGGEGGNTWVRQVVVGRLPGSCQSLLIKSVIEMSTELAKKKRKQQKLEKGKQKKEKKKPLDQIKYLPGQDGQNLRECVCRAAFNR